MLTYEDARATVMAADQDPFTLPSYTGGEFDLDYLKNWVLDQVETIYNVSADIFDQATIYSTSILRDFVHRALYQEVGRENIVDIEANGELQYSRYTDVATAFRYPAYGLCDTLAWQEYQVFRAFGYQTKDIAIYNAPMDQYTDSHVTTEVYLTDLDQYVMQDATFNFVLRDKDGAFLSFDQARYDLYTQGSLTFDAFNDYSQYFQNQTYAATTPSSVVDVFENGYFKVPYWAYTGTDELQSLTRDLFPDSFTAHDPSSNQGLTFGASGYAEDAIQRFQAAGQDWQSIAITLAGLGYYVSGFALATDTQDIISHWITVRLNDGDYISFDLDHHIELNGSYDQLADEATGGPDLNPGASLTDFLRPAYLISYSGDLESGFVPSPGEHVAEFGDLVLRNVNTGMVKLWDMPDTNNLLSGQTISSVSDLGFKIVGQGDYTGDYGHDILFQKASNGQVGFWDSSAHWTSLGSMPSGWNIVSTDDHSDFNGDGSDDILWHNQASPGNVGFWSLVNGVNTGFVQITGVSPIYQVIATGDFNGDGTDDILWQNTQSHSLTEWLMKDGHINQSLSLTPQTNSSFLTVADLNRDGTDDILWKNDSTTQVTWWEMQNGYNSQTHYLVNAPVGSTLIATKDMTADGTPDLVWDNQSSGQVLLWNMDHVADAHPNISSPILGVHANDWVIT